ncbi:MAG: CBS domain-containing protein [Lacipirellulaceae bacterium]
MDFQLSLATESVRSAYPEAPVAVESDASVADVVRLMQASKVPAALVCDGDRLVGVFTERDVLRLMAAGGEFVGPIASVMSHNPVTVDSTTTVGEAIRRMSAGGYRHLPLVDSPESMKPTGVVTVRGIVRYLVEHFPNTIYNLPPTPSDSHAEREGA